MKKILLFLITFSLMLYSVLINVVISEAAFNLDTYYSSVDTTKRGEELLSDLTVVCNPSDLNIVSYAKAYEHLETIDEDPNNPNNILCVYSRVSIPKSHHYSTSSTNFNTTPGDSWAREHVWSQSHGQLNNNKSKGYSDLHNLHAIDQKINVAHSNKDFDNCKEVPGAKNFALEVDYSVENWYTSNAFEPNDEMKGDVARTLFYMCAMYNDTNLKLSLLDQLDTDVLNTSNSGYFGKLSTLLEWNLSDPVSDEERARNEKVYAIQNNRNPFVDHPEYANLVWDYERIVNVSFETFGGTVIPSLDVTSGTTITKPTAPLKEGYTFEGWYTDYLLTNKFDFTEQVNTNLVLYAHYIDNTVTKFSSLKASLNFNISKGDGVKLESYTQIKHPTEIYLSTTVNENVFYNGICSSKTLNIVSNFNESTTLLLVPTSTSGEFYLKQNDKYLCNSSSTEIETKETIDNTNINLYIWTIGAIENKTGMFIINKGSSRPLLHRYELNADGSLKYNYIKAYKSTNLGNNNYYTPDIYYYDTDVTTFNSFAMRFGGFINKTEVDNLGVIQSMYLLVCPTDILVSNHYEYLKEVSSSNYTNLSILKINVDASHIYDENKEEGCLAGIIEEIPLTRLDTYLSVVYVIESENGVYYSNQKTCSFDSVVEQYYNTLNENSLQLTDLQMNYIQLLYNERNA